MDVTDSHVAVGGDFSQIFDPNDYLAMLNVKDEAMCVLRAHLVLEEFLGLWAAKITNTQELFSGTFVPFKTKLVISKNLGLPIFYFEVLDRINEIRNRFTHRRSHKLEDSNIDSLKARVDSIMSTAQLNTCEQFSLHSSGIDQFGKPAEQRFSWAEADNRIRFIIIFAILMLKLTTWIQSEFIKRGITFNLIAP